jgi:hypothetical protein
VLGFEELPSVDEAIAGSISPSILTQMPSHDKMEIRDEDWLFDVFFSLCQFNRR